MPSPALPTMPVNDYLTRKLLRKIAGTGTPLTALLEQLVTDSIYTLKDDFDRGLDENLWFTRGLRWNDNDDNGALDSSSDEELPEGAGPQGMFLMSFGDGWRLNRRPVVQCRVDFSPAAQLSHFEVGFVSEMPSDGRGVVHDINSSTTERNTGVQTFTVAARDRSFDEDEAFYVVSGGSHATSGSDEVDSQVVTPNPPLSGPMTLMVCANEQGETRLWVNGQHDNSFSEEADVIKDLGCHLWVFGDRGSYSLDYIHAWRERTSL